MIGKTISHYKIIEKLGEGGMGEVYLAEDTLLYRQVAIKTLPTSLISDPQNIEHTILEARTTSSLNHPNICTVYDVIEEENQYFIIMEYIEGDTLREIIEKKGPLSTNEALDIILEVCRALKATHLKNIIHRDIKPENIMITHDGFIKIMDFGLAKLRNVQGFPINKSQEVKTSSSMVLGTVSYMAPEQFDYKDVDERTDIYCVGAVLYELFTSHLPFQGKYVFEVAQSILKTEPKRLSEYNKKVDSDLENIVLKALAKEPSDRHKNIEELYTDLKKIKEKLSRRIFSENKTSFIFISVVFLLVIVLVVKSILYKEEVPVPGEVKPITTTSKILEVGTGISPDGNYISFSSDENGNMDLWVQQLDSEQEKVNLTKDYIGSDNGGFWSPNSQYLAFISARDGGGIFIIHRDGKNLKKIISEDYSKLRWLCWSPDGKRLAYTIEGKLFIIDIESGAPAHIPLPHNCVFLNWSPICDRIIYVLGPPNNFSQIWSVKSDGINPIALLSEPMGYQFPTWSRDGNYVFFKSNFSGTRDIWWFPVNKKGIPKRNPQPLTTGANSFDFSLSEDGKKLVYMRGGYEFNIYSLPIDMEQIYTIENAKQITFEQQQIKYIAVSNNQKWIAYILLKVGGKEFEIWQCDIDGKNKKRIYSNKFGIGKVCWSPNDDQLVFDSKVDGLDNIYAISINEGEVKPIVSGPFHDYSPSWSPIGNEIVYCSDREGSYDLWIVSVLDGKLRPITDINADEVNPCWSPDGRFIAFLSNETGYWEIYIVAANGEEKPRKLTNLKLQGPGQINKMFLTWSINGDEIYTTFKPGGDDQSRKIIAISIEDGTYRIIYDCKAGNLQGAIFPSLSMDKNNLYFIPQFHIGDIYLLNLEYK